MPPSARKNAQANIFSSGASDLCVQVSTMGREYFPCILRLEKMRLTGMNEENDADTAMGLKEDPLFDPNENIQSVRNFEDLENLKAQVQRLAFHSDCSLTLAESNRQEKDNASPPASTSGGERSLSLSSDDTLNCDDCKSTGRDSNDVSLIVDPESHEHFSNGSGTDDNVNMLKPDLTKPGGQVRGIGAGLLMSPVLLTEDVPMNVGTSNRLSSVLENMPLPLLYIPTTKQLVNGEERTKRSAGSPDSSSASDKYFGRVNSSPEAFSHREYSGSELLSRSHASGSDLLGPMFHTVSSSNDFDGSVRPEPDQVTLNSIESFTSNTLFCDPSARLYTDTSSLSSVSTGTDFSVSAVSLGDDCGAEPRQGMCDVDDGTFMEVSLHGRNSYEKARNISLDSGFEDHGAKPKRKGLPGFLTRSLFSKKTREESAPGWKLFGRVPPKDSGTKDSTQITSDYYAKQRANQIAAAQAKGQSSDIMSTTALILENRPVGLPSKSPEETEKHKQEYEAMVEAAKKKELRDIKLKKRKLQQQRRHEDRMVAAANSWNKEILPNWETMKSTKKVRDLWWMGLPPNVRGKVWKMAVGNELNITHDLYEICRSRAEDRIRLIQESKEAPGSPETFSDPPSNKEASVKVIKLDVSRTFPQLCIFQKGGPYHDMMHSLLGAYACYRPDVGYVQGMSFIAAILLLNMEVADAFVCFANLLNRPCQVSFFRMDEGMLTAYYRAFEEFFLENLPQLYAHFSMHHVTPNLYLMEWVFLLFSKSLPLDVACRVWDVYCRDGEEFLFQTAIGILKFYEAILLQMDFIHVAQFLTKLPEDISSDLLFKHIETVRMSIDKKKFPAILSHYKDLGTEGIS